VRNGVLQRVTACCGVFCSVRVVLLQCDVVCCSMLQSVAVCYSVLQCVLQCVAVR